MQKSKRNKKEDSSYVTYKSLSKNINVYIEVLQGTDRLDSNHLLSR